MSKTSSRLRKGPSRDGVKENFWRKTLREHAASGLGVRAFCRGRGLSEPSFYGWRRTLAQRDRSGTRRRAASSRPRFVELRPQRAPRTIAVPANATPLAVAPSPASSVAATPASSAGEAPLEIAVGNLRLVIRPGCDRLLLRDVLDLLARRDTGPEA